MKIFALALTCLLLTCCELRVETVPRTTTGVIFIEDTCHYGEPYWHTPDWCVYYNDGATCCAWYVDGWYDEWCQWYYASCWEYQGSW